MKKTIWFVLLFFVGFPIQAQNNKASVLSSSDTRQIFTDSVKTQFAITYNIFRVYKYSNKEST
jgi:hypothetical protein